MKQRSCAYGASLPRQSAAEQTASMAGTFGHTFQAGDIVSACPTKLFEYLDDPRHLAFLVPMSHSIQNGHAVTCLLDKQQGRGVGARVRREGLFSGRDFEVDEEVDFYAPPRRKVWRTVGKPRLFIIESYRMGFEVEPLPVGTDLCVFIDWNSVHDRSHYLLDWVAERWARRFVNGILELAKRHFEADVPTTSPF